MNLLIIWSQQLCLENHPVYKTFRGFLYFFLPSSQLYVWYSITYLRVWYMTTMTLRFSPLTSTNVIPAYVFQVARALWWYYTADLPAVGSLVYNIYIIRQMYLILGSRSIRYTTPVSYYDIRDRVLSFLTRYKIK